MTSRLPYAPPGMAIAMAGGGSASLQDRIARLGLTPRQLELNRKWSFYKTDQYASRMTTWDGHRVMTDVERESAAHTQNMPAGFWDPGARFDDVPLMMRKPSAPYHLVRVVVNRFTGLLFSAKMHPQIQLLGAADAQAWIDGLLKTSRLWIRMAYARTLGGAQGSVAVTFQFRNGKPTIEVHDARWCFPTFTDRITGEMSALEIKYMYPVDEIDANGVPKVVDYWYRRVIDIEMDTIFKPALVGDGSEDPVWEVDQQVPHNLGELPGVWIRNSQTDDQDGECDCEGAYDTQETIDTLLSQGTQGAVENCDPTLAVASSELDSSDLRKGSFNGLKLEVGGTAQYVEMTGSGTKAAIDMFEVHKKNFLEVVQCVLESESATAATATEIKRRYSSMHQRGDLFREQYGEMGIKPLIGKMVRAIIKLRAGAVNPDTGVTTVGQVFVSPTVDATTGKLIHVELPATINEMDDSHLEIKWPEWVESGPADAQLAAGAVSTAVTSSTLDQESAVRYLAPFFNIDDPTKAVAALIAAKQAEADSLMGEELLAARQQNQAQQPIDPNATPIDAKAQDTALNGAQVTAALEICARIPTGEIMPEAAVLMLLSFGLISDEVAARKIVTEQTKAKPPVPDPGGFGGFHGGPPHAAPAAPPGSPPPHGAAPPPTPGATAGPSPRGSSDDGPKKPAPGHQEKPWSCGPAALEKVCTTLGLDITEAQLRTAGNVTEDGMDEGQLIKAAQAVGLKETVHHTGDPDQSWEQLVSDLVDGSPHVLCVDQWDHWVAVVGVVGDRVVVLDSSNTPDNVAQNGVHTVTKEQLLKRWTYRGTEKSLYSVSFELA